MSATSARNIQRQLTINIAVYAMMLCATTAYGQGMAINATGTPANSSAMLDVASTTQGLLVPRMLSTQRAAIATPATGLLVYQTDAPAGFYNYNGSSWVSLSADSTAMGGDLTGNFPAPSIAVTSTAGNHAVSAINAGSSVVNPSRLGTGTANSTTFLRGDGTWNTPATTTAAYFIPMGSGSSRVALTTTSTGPSDSICFIGVGAAGNQLINVNGGSYIDPSGTYPMVAEPVPISATVTSFSFYFRITNNSPILFLTGTYTFQAQLYYTAPPGSTLIGSEQFYPVTGATVSINLNTATGGIGIMGETLTANITGLSYALAAGSRLMVMVNYSDNTSPSSLQTLTGNVTASVGMH